MNFDRSLTPINGQMVKGNDFTNLCTVHGSDIRFVLYPTRGKIGGIRLDKKRQLFSSADWFQATENLDETSL